MNRKFLLTCLAAVALVWQLSPAAESSPGESLSAPSTDRGSKVYQAHCVGCHGFGGKGDGPLAASLGREFGVKPTDLTRKYLRNRSDEGLALAISQGGPAVHRTSYMPAWGKSLSKNQVGDLVSYVRALQAGKAAKPTSLPGVSEQLELGRFIYTIQCLVCHGENGDGDGPFFAGLKTGKVDFKTVPPKALSSPDFFDNLSDRDIAKVVKKIPHHSGLGNNQAYSWHLAISDQEMEALTLYLRTLKLNGTKPTGQRR